MPKKLANRKPYLDFVTREFVNGRSAGSPAMHARMLKEAEAGRLPSGVPSPRTIGAMLLEARELPAAARRAFIEVTWPSSFMAGHVPWEMTPNYFELTANSILPTALVLEWFWRVSLALPHASGSDRYRLALACISSPDSVEAEIAELSCQL